MAAAARHLSLRLAPRLVIRSCRYASGPKTFRPRSQAPIPLRRPISTTPTRLQPQGVPVEEDEDDDDDDDEDEDTDDDDEDDGEDDADLNDLNLDEEDLDDINDDIDEDIDEVDAKEAQELLDGIPPEERGELDRLLARLTKRVGPPGSSEEMGLSAEEAEALEQEVDAAAFRHKGENPDTVDPEQNAMNRIDFSEGFLAMGEAKDAQFEDDEWENDDITTKAHGELDQIREIREYARLAAWELPLLSKFAKPYEPPPMFQPLRFRYTSYLGESHPAARKVVLQFAPADLPNLTSAQHDKLLKLLGPRYNPSTQVARMSCETHETSAQNKRHLSDLVDSLLHEAREGADTFADVPLDVRHHKPRPFHAFPESWFLTPERLEQVQRGWERSARIEAERRSERRLVDGAERVRQALPPPVLERGAVPQRVRR